MSIALAMDDDREGDEDVEVELDRSLAAKIAVEDAGQCQYDATAIEANHRSWFGEFRGFLADRMPVFCPDAEDYRPGTIATRDDLGREVDEAENRAIVACLNACTRIAERYAPRRSTMDFLRPGRN